MNQGWIKLHRKLLEHPKSNDSEFMNVWITLLLLATHSEVKKDFGGKTITLKPGQLITSRKSLSKQTGIQESKIERVLKRLKTEQQIEQVSSFSSRLISVVNWGVHQKSEQPNEQQVNSSRTASEHKQEGKKEKKEKNVLKDIDQIYQAYPKKVGKEVAIKSIQKAVKKIEVQDLLEIVEIYSSKTTWMEKKFIPNPATWFNQERWLDDQSEWEQEEKKTRTDEIFEDYQQNVLNQGEINGVSSQSRNSNNDLPATSYELLLAKQRAKRRKGRENPGKYLGN